MRTNCIPYPDKERLIIVRQSQIDVCEGNTAAAACLSLFEYWHNIKLEMRRKNKKANDVAEIHGDERLQDESLLQFHTQDEIKESLLGLVGMAAIRKALVWLEEVGFVSVHKNPNPKYKFDNTKHFLLHPEKVIEKLNQIKNRSKSSEYSTLSNCNSRDYQIDKSEGKTEEHLSATREDENQNTPSTLSNCNSRDYQNDRMVIPNQQDGPIKLIGTIPEITSKITSENSLSLCANPLAPQTTTDDPAGREREQNLFEKKKPETQSTDEPDLEHPDVGDPPDFRIPGLGPHENNFTPPDWLDTKRWQLWLDSRTTPHLKPFSLRSECRRLGELISQGWSQTEILDDAAARSKARLSAPCVPGDEQKILAERRAEQGLKPDKVNTDEKINTAVLRQKIRDAHGEIEHLERLILITKHAANKQHLENQKNQASSLVYKLKSELLALEGTA